jgi:hypothetical protein
MSAANYASQHNTNLNPNPVLSAAGNPTSPLPADAALLAEAGLPAEPAPVPAAPPGTVYVNGFAVDFDDRPA